jgi:hypothetical protein
MIRETGYTDDPDWYFVAFAVLLGKCRITHMIRQRPLSYTNMFNSLATTDPILLAIHVIK